MRKLRNLFQSTRPVRGATLQVCPSASYSVISIHAPRAGRDHNGKCKPAETVGISIHAPRAGRDLAGGALKSFRSGFQSTRPVRGAPTKQRVICSPVDISIHAPRAGRDNIMEVGTSKIQISIHAPRAGRDTKAAALWAGDIISIHAPRAGRDKSPTCRPSRTAYFNPRAPCGARLSETAVWDTELLFQSTRPVRGATTTDERVAKLENISIHAPRAGRDRETMAVRQITTISIHAPRAGRDGGQQGRGKR